MSQRAAPLLGEEINPWLAPRVEETSVARKKHEVVVSKTSTSADKSRHKFKKRAQKREDEKERIQDDATVEISLSSVLTVPSEGSLPASSSDTSASKKATEKSRDNASTAPQPIEDDESESDANSELDEQEKLLDRKGKGRAKGVKAFEQRDLVALAFAGDNVVQVRPTTRIRSATD